MSGEPKPNYAKKAVLTAWTVFIWIFRSPTMLMLIVGFSLGYYGGWQAGKASALPRAIKAETELRDLQTEMAKAIERAAVKQVFIRDQIRREFDDAQIKLDAINLRLRDMRRAASVCDSESVMPVTGTSPGIDEESNSGQPRPADFVLQELVAEISRKCDGQAEQLNSLIDWINETRN